MDLMMMVDNITAITVKKNGTNTTTIMHSSLTMTIAFVIIGILGLFGNVIVIVVLTSERSLRRRFTNIYIINQSAIDLASSIMIIAHSYVNGEVIFEGILGELYCRLWQTKMFLWSFMFSSTCNLVIMTMERYSELIYPLKHKTSFTKKKAYFTIAFAWASGPVLNMSYMIKTSVIENKQCHPYSSWTSATSQKAVGLIIVFLQYIIPLVILTYCYSYIALMLHRKLKEDLGEPNRPRDDKWQKGRRNSVKTLVLVALCFVLCWTSNQIYFLLFNLGMQLAFDTDFYHFTVIAVFINSCAKPVIYSFQYEQFQKAAKRLCMRCGGRSATADTAGSDSLSSLTGTSNTLVTSKHQTYRS